VGAVLLVALLTAPVELLFFELVIPWTWLRWLLVIAAIYAVFWLLGLYASLVVLPHRLESDALRLRYGALAEGRIPYDAIDVVERARRSPPGGRDGFRVARAADAAEAYLAVGGRTAVTLRLRAPRALAVLRGMAEPVTAVHLAVDEPERFVRELQRRIGADAARTREVVTR
jgi:hypothetical protein